MSEFQDNATTLARILARTPQAKVVKANQWEVLASEIVTISKTSGGLLAIYGDVGSGKTTFATMLTNLASSQVDVLAVSPASQISESGWLPKAIAPWLSSESNDTKSIQRKLSSLADTDRSILIVIDGADFIASDVLSGDIASILNLSHHAGVKLALVTLATRQKLSDVLTDNRLIGKILLHRPLPMLTNNQIAELLQSRRLDIGSFKLSNHQTETQKIAEESLGNPLIALTLLAKKLGIFATDPNGATDQTKRLKTSLRNKQQREEPIDLEDLLTPKNNGNIQK